MLQSISSITPSISSIKDHILRSLDVPEDTFQSIPVAKSPDPKLGDLGFPVFALARILRKSPQQIAQSLAETLNSNPDFLPPFIERWAPAGSYVNVFLKQSEISFLILNEALARLPFGQIPYDTNPNHINWMVEFSAPNTNKPQHLGHVRNNLLGDVSSRLLQFTGDRVVRVNLINDRGIHICKSMLAYKLHGNGETPQSTGIKGDKLVGNYYVLFNNLFKEEYAQWLKTDAAQLRFESYRLNKNSPGDSSNASFDDFSKAYEDQYFNCDSSLGAQTKEMLRKWESNDPDVRALWNTMNQWVFDGFDQTYSRLKISFDRVYKESNTYKLGREIVENGLKMGVFHKLDDGAVACNLDQIGLPNQTKILLRNDGTTVYMTQDLGTALARFDEYHIDQMVYCVGNEQDYHFQVLFGILGLLRPELKGHFRHLSYGMVELPDGKMKSREGTVVDADDLMQQTFELAKQAVLERYDDLTDADVDYRAEVIALAGLKFNILDYNPKTTVHFDPKKSLEFQGRTGPYCLYTYARIQSILRSLEQDGHRLLDLSDHQFRDASNSLDTPLELDVLRELQEWPTTLVDAAKLFEPNRITEQLFRIAKAFSSLYNDPDHRIKDLEGDRLNGLLLLCEAVARTMKTGLAILGIETLTAM